MSDDDNSGVLSGLPWSPSRSPQVEGRRLEAKSLKARGAVLHPNSGAGPIKDDGHDDVHQYECKDARKSYTLNGKEMQATFVRAIRQGRVACWLVNFKDLGFTVECKLIPNGKGVMNE